MRDVEASMSIVENLKDVVATIQKIDNIELFRQILDLQNEVSQVLTENGELKAQVKRLTEEASFRRSLRFEFNAYWSGDSLESSDGPFCSKCWDADQKVVRLHVASDNPQWSRCPVCQKLLLVPRRENKFDVSTETEPLVIAIEGPLSDEWGPFKSLR
jgi:hypothetical protein